MRIAPFVLAAASAFVAVVASAHGDLPDAPDNAHGVGNDLGPDDELEVKPGIAAPAGYHLGKRARTASIIGGALLFVPSYGLAVSRAFGSDCDGCGGGRQHRLFVPFAGPFLYAFGCDGCGSQLLWATDAVVQIAGAALIVYGLVPRTVWVLDHTAEVTVAPTIGAGNTGISLIGRF